MKGLILYNPYYNDDRVTAQVRRIAEELSALGAATETRANIGTAFLTESAGDTETLLSGDTDFVVFLDKDKYAPRLLEQKGVRVFNPAAAIEICDDKMLTHIALAGQRIAMPATIPGLLCFTPAPLDTDYCRFVAGRLGLPLVVKECYGSMGKGVYLARTFEELTAIAERVKMRPHLFQRFVASGAARDIRVMVIGGRAAAWMLRKSDTDFRSNIELGGKGYKVDLEPAFRDLAERAARTLRLDYCGVDLLIGGRGEPLLCEVNSNAFFGESERVTGVNVAGAYAKHIVGELQIDNRKVKDGSDSKEWTSSNSYDIIEKWKR
ncbi:hypothetical protein FACS1894211_13590 [Clostridia bacterium]|nr:hypothetical protein FACS1894211_13590 [Clostridia bacterium]